MNSQQSPHSAYLSHSDQLAADAKYAQQKAIENSPLRQYVDGEIRKLLQAHFEKHIPADHETRDLLIQQSIDFKIKRLRQVYAHSVGMGVGSIDHNEISSARLDFPYAWWLIKAEANCSGRGLTDQQAIEEIGNHYSEHLKKLLK